MANLITGCETTLSVLYSQITTIFCTLHIFDLLKGQLISDHISPYYTNEKLTIFLTNRSTTDILWKKTEWKISNVHKKEKFPWFNRQITAKRSDIILPLMYCIRHVDKKNLKNISSTKKEALHLNAYICSTAIYYEYFKYMHLEFF